jgi:hypothetical protein
MNGYEFLFYFFICFSLFEVYVVLSYRFGPRKELFGFIVNLYFIWYFKSNVQGMNFFEEKKIMYQANGCFGSLGNFGFFFFFLLTFFFDDG